MVSVSVRVSAKAFWFASQFKANNDIRYYLNSVKIKKHPEKGAFVAGCDGHVIGIYHDPLAEFSCEENEIIDHSSGVACAFGSDKNAFAYFMPMRPGNAEFMSNAKHAFPMLKGV